MFIYGLSSSAEPGVIRYIGQTKKNIAARLTDHVYEAQHSGRGHKNHWIKKTMDEGFVILSSFVAFATSDDELDNLERYYIAKLRAEGVKLTNNADGGHPNRGFRHSEETRKRLSEIPGRKKADEEKAQISATLLELYASDSEIRQKVSDGIKKANAEGRGMFGRNHSETTKAKVSESCKKVCAEGRGRWAGHVKRVIPKTGSEEDHANRSRAQAARRLRESVEPKGVM